MSTKKQSVRKWKIDRLKDHPQQAAIFGDVPDEEMNALVEDMRKHGLRDPVEILPDGTIVCGHQRVRAAKVLGWKEIEVVVREDLAAAGPAAVETYFVEDNFVRRQLSPLARARCIKRLMELEVGRSADGFRYSQKEALKARIARRMGLSTRSVNRYLLILETPSAIQRAFEEGAITLINAGKVALLPKSVQAGVSRRIEQGERAASVVAQSLGDQGGRQEEPSQAFTRLVGMLKREVPKLQGRATEIRARQLQRSLPALLEASKVLSEVIKRAEREAS